MTTRKEMINELAGHAIDEWDYDALVDFALIHLKKDNNALSDKQLLENYNFMLNAE